MESGDEGGSEADDECGEDDGALSLIPTTPVVTMDMRTWDELLPKVLHESSKEVVLKVLCAVCVSSCFKHALRSAVQD